ncbi:MAG: response regulator [Gemmatimonadetes bacterium]|nr:response regulator [Gemmatimonadota bacterium]
MTIRTWVEGGRVFCRVHDTGPGVPPEARSRVFSPFFSTNVAGAGLGLTVSRNMIRAAGGDLVLDENESGASFTFWLPAAPAEADEGSGGPSDGSQAHGSLKNRVIVVADDEDAIRNVLDRFLRREGSRVIAVGGGREALDVIRSEPVDAVLLDVRMPDLDGARVYQALLAERPEVAARTLFLSGDATGVAHELGVPGHRVLLKPIELAELRRVLINLLNGG